MAHLRNYLITISAAALICGTITSFFGKKTSYSVVIKLLTGIFMTITVISPIIRVKIADFSDYMDAILSDGKEIVTEGQQAAEEQYREVIIQQTEAYILDKATSLGAELEAEVTLSESSPPIPVSVKIKGAVSPHAKQVLQNYLSSQLGISKEHQLWT